MILSDNRDTTLPIPPMFVNFPIKNAILDIILWGIKLDDIINLNFPGVLNIEKPFL